MPLMVVMTPSAASSTSFDEPMSPIVKASSSSLLSFPLTLEDSSPPPRLSAFMGLIYVAMSAVCFSLVSTCVKYATFYMTSMEFIFWRSIVALAMNYIAIRKRGESLTIEPTNHWRLFLQCLFGFASVAFGFYAFSQMVLADASVIIFTSPVVTFFLGACLLKEKVDSVSFSCAVISLAGLVFVLRPTFLFGSTSGAMDAAGVSTWVAMVCAIAAAVSQALLYTCVRTLQGIHFLAIVHYFMLFSIFVSGLWIVFSQKHIFVDFTFWLWMVILASGLWTFLGQITLTKGFQLEKAGVASVMRYLDVVCVFIWDSLLLHERVSGTTIFGAVIICSCAGVIALRKASE
uniref:EamA domain-containing protein n=1 Tax=Globisporangium ultimum (strain ATCC 200006 / CBS 805.95 / DAOM BR144) TaxID=431595 RepID=K3X107_GLOUD